MKFITTKKDADLDTSEIMTLSLTDSHSKLGVWIKQELNPGETEVDSEAA